MHVPCLTLPEQLVCDEQLLPLPLLHFSFPISFFLSILSFLLFLSSFPSFVFVCIYDVAVYCFLKFPLASTWIDFFDRKCKRRSWKVNFFFYAELLHISLVITRQMETKIYTWEGWSWGGGGGGRRHWRMASSKPTVNGNWVACGQITKYLWLNH